VCDVGAAPGIPAQQAHPVMRPEAERRLRISPEPVDEVTLTILVENVFDIWMPDQGPARRFNPTNARGRVPAATMEDGSVPEGLVAEHGYSVLVDVRRGESTHRILFDCGTTPDGVVENMRRLSIDPRDVEAIVCSHGHFDHTAGLDGLTRHLGRTGLPVLIHPDFWNRRRVCIPGREPEEIPTTSRRALEEAGFTVVEERQPSFLLDNAVLVTGEVDRTTGYEPGFPLQQAYRDGQWEPDPLVLDDQALIVHVRDRGLVVITGCGHAGIVNITRYARALTGVDQVHALVGGFHLNGPLFEPLIARVCDDLSAMQPDVVVPGHCTGWRAQHAMARSFGEGFIPSCVGTRLDLRTA
jgi:7,8-dihydropterin-6-yl-methyl-4-(beta-D-ribofuranosyl)aminobenzene 5'-phosphate synthase